MTVIPPFVVPLFAIGVLVAIVLFLVVSTYNRFVALRNRIAKAWANVDVALFAGGEEGPLPMPGAVAPRGVTRHFDASGRTSEGRGGGA